MAQIQHDVASSLSGDGFDGCKSLLSETDETNLADWLQQEQKFNAAHPPYGGYQGESSGDNQGGSYSPDKQPYSPYQELQYGYYGQGEASEDLPQFTDTANEMWDAPEGTQSADGKKAAAEEKRRARRREVVLAAQQKAIDLSILIRAELDTYSIGHTTDVEARKISLDFLKEAVTTLRAGPDGEASEYWEGRVEGEKNSKLNTRVFTLVKKSDASEGGEM